MRADRELLADALKLIEYGIRSGEAHEITEEIRARLAEPEDEPAAWMDIDGNVSDNNDYNCFPIPLYRHTPRQPVLLSDEEIQECFDAGQKSFLRHQSGIKGQQLTIRDWPYWHFAKAIEQAVLEKNQ